jgi:hypothetical protein
MRSRRPGCSAKSDSPRRADFLDPARRPAPTTHLREKQFFAGFSHKVVPGATGCAS